MADTAHQCTIVGIAGASASGKSLIASTLYRELRAQVGDHNIGVIPEDCYYRDQSDLTMEERYKVNYDHPNSMDHALLYQHLCELKAGNAIELLNMTTLLTHAKQNPYLLNLKKLLLLKVFCY